MNKEQLLLISGIFFILVSIMHLVRFFTAAEVIIFGTTIPLLISLFISVVSAIFAYLLFNPKD
tara:strand:+ start:63 stop:251 length:189 start_codon:yes stop_codon:yes gene_type:complete